jgi:PAS domain S-box-containing protein
LSDGERGQDPELPDEDLLDLYENAPCGYVSLRMDGRIFKANRTFAAWLGYDQGELIGKRWHDLLNVASRIYFETHFAPLLRMQGFFNEVAVDLTGRRGRLPVLVNAMERRDEAGRALFIRITVFNATDRRRYEHELLEARSAAERARAELEQINATLEQRVAAALTERIKAEDALRQSQKMEAIGQLTGGVAHDFNNLLTVVIGGLDSVRRQIEKLPDSAELARMRRASEMALHGARRAATLTARLLAFARKQPLDPKIIEPNRLIAGLADMLQRTLGETIALETVSGAGLWRALADPAELENAIVNLAVNARDAMPRGGTLTIETGNVFLDEAYTASVPEPVAAGQYAMIAVSDTGHGMSPEILARVFEPFFTTKESGKGTGLGLSQVYGFVRQSGGHIRVYSEVGQGTSVKLYLPRATGVQQEDRPGARGEGKLEGGAETILVVEDHEDLRAYSAGALRELGYRVLEAGAGPAALELLQQNADVALLFTDVVLPGGLNGRMLSDEAQRRRPGIQILFTTGYTRNAIVHDGRLDAGVHLLTKPFTCKELAAKVRAILDSGG